ncbi:MAG: trypsin-like peptidase domain-containing protein [Rhodospirillaceae bacterium]|jgi:serine protease Do|nr:trypsin-like peptidase domain-containing protein [Rhodospirillaceae bacterium]MBT6119833.1 trypsin-like peptidase domain-containing protein [Rhodospirillaceae bacterium]
MADETKEASPRSSPRSSAVAVLEHLTGPSRGTVTWLGAASLDVSLSAGRLIRTVETGADAASADLVARLHRVGDGFEIEALDSAAIWVNGARTASRRLAHGDMIEFGEKGPLSRFRLQRDGRQTRKTLGDILGDEAAYLRSSRQPLARRLVRAVCALARRVAGETTVLFRVGVVLVLIAFAVLIYQQVRLTARLEQGLESGSVRLDSFAAALARARNEALTPADLASLREDLAGRLVSNVERLEALERRSQAAARVIAASAGSVVLLQGAYGFREADGGRLLRHMVDDEGRRIYSSRLQPMLTLEGEGPVAERQVVGTGFALGADGVLVTNRHVVRPWESDADIETLAADGFEPVMLKLLAYRPGEVEAVPLTLLRSSEAEDLALLARADDGPAMPGLPLAEDVPAAGDEVLVMGYPTGLRSLLAQSGAAFIAALQESGDMGFWSVAARLAEAGYIAPLASRGIVGQATVSTIVYDADTTHGGSGGPVLNLEGAVVAVNAAVLPEYGGSNIGIPAAKLRTLLEEAGLR